MTFWTAFVAGLAVCLVAGPAAAATYWVAPAGDDTGPGTKQKPWATLQHAVDAVSPGDTALVRAGTYAGCVMRRSGRADAPYTLKAEPGATVLVDKPGPENRRRSNLEVGARGQTVGYWVVDGFEVANAPMWGINLGRTEHVTVRNCRVHDCHQTGIFTSFSDHPLIENNESYRNHEHGIYHSNSGDYPILRGNRCHHNDCCGIHMNGDINMGGDGLISHAVVERNIIWENGRPRGGSGINCDGVSDSVIRNNLLYDNHASGISIYAIDGAEGSSRNGIYNNTVVVAADGRWALNIPWWQRRSKPVGNRVANNLLLSLNPQTGAILIWGEEAVAECDHNVVTARFAVDAVIGSEVPMPAAGEDRSVEGGHGLLSFTQWRTQGRDAHSRVGTPAALFVNPSKGDYHLRSGATAKGAGTHLPEVTDDLDGRRRPAAGPADAGCYAAR